MKSLIVQRKAQGYSLLCHYAMDEMPPVFYQKLFPGLGIKRIRVGSQSQSGIKKGCDRFGSHGRIIDSAISVIRVVDDSGLIHSHLQGLPHSTASELKGFV
jgi:hypothetical protein